MRYLSETRSPMANGAVEGDIGSRPESTRDRGARGAGRLLLRSPTMSLAPTQDPAWLSPGVFVDSDHPDVVAFAQATCAGATTDAERARALFRAVRERLRYDPYSFTPDPNEQKASTLLARERAWCVPKAVLLCAASRAVGIPARLGFADVRNHLASPKLIRVLGTDLFVYHGYVELFLGGRIVKATPAFNEALCERFRVPVLDFDGETDAMLQTFSADGQRHMEYVRERGTYADLPFAQIVACFAETYGRMHRARTSERDEVFEE